MIILLVATTTAVLPSLEKKNHTRVTIQFSGDCSQTNEKNISVQIRMFVVGRIQAKIQEENLNSIIKMHRTMNIRIM